MKKPSICLSFLTVSLCLLCWLSKPTPLWAQSPGNNAVWGSGGTPSGSAAYIDASASAALTDDICTTLFNIISNSNYPARGAVIDARGISANNSKSDGNGNMTCAGTPWQSGSSSTTNPATILLPAGYTLQCTGCSGPGNIVISQTWVLPNGSKIIGEGPDNGPNATLQAASGSSFTGSAMIEMGSSSPPFACPGTSVPVCTGVVVDHLTLEASSNNIDGIHNAYSQEGSYARDVRFTDFGGTGLSVSAPYSGPYIDLYYTASSEEQCSEGVCPACARLNAQTLGIHGVTCIGTDAVAGLNNGAAIFVDASSNTVEDIRVEGFSDSVRIGDIASGIVGNVVVSNINSAIGTTGQIKSVVHVCGRNPNTNFLSCPNNNANGGATVNDIVVLQATDFNGNNTSPPPTRFSAVIQDDVTGTLITPQGTGTAFGGTTGLYTLGEQEGGNGYLQYPRLATNPSPNGNNFSTAVPTWIVGTGSIAGQQCSLPGALYSNTTGSSSSALYVCKWVLSTSLQWTDLL
jgi:hypothetical protein